MDIFFYYSGIIFWGIIALCSIALLALCLIANNIPDDRDEY